MQAIATIGVGGAVGYKAKKDLEPLVKELQSSPKNLGKLTTEINKFVLNKENFLIFSNSFKSTVFTCARSNNESLSLYSTKAPPF